MQKLVHFAVTFACALLCENAVYAQTATPPASLSVYRSDAFSLEYPAGWTITPRSDGSLYFGPNAAPTCSQPGLIVTPVKLQTPTRTPDILLDDYTATNSYLTPVGDRADAGDLGRTAVFSGPCTDGSTRILRVSTYVAFGNGYRTTAFAPKSAFKQWDAVFQPMAASFIPAVPGSNGASGQPIQAPDGASSTLLVHVFNGNVFMANVADLPGAPLTHDADVINGTRRYGLPRISPDGKQVAFAALPGGDLYIAPIAKNATPAALNVKLAAPYPPIWSPDGKSIAFVGIKDNALALYTIQPGGSAAQSIASLGTTPCQASTISDPSAAALSTDLDANANGDTLLLEWPTAGTLLISRDCSGVGVDKVDAASGKRTSVADLSRAVLSQDKSTLAGIVAGKLAIISLADGQLKPLPPQADRVTWNDDGTALFYTTRTISNPLSLTSASSGISPFESALYNLTLHRITLATGQDDSLYTDFGYAIGSMVASPEGSGLLFSVIQDDTTLIQALAKPLNADDVRRILPTAQLYWLPFPVASGEKPTLLAETLHPTFGPVGSTAVIGLPVTPRPNGTNIPGG